MMRKKWVEKCAWRFIDAAKIDTGEAAAAAEICADLEELTNGTETEIWLAPEQAADEEMARWAAEKESK